MATSRDQSALRRKVQAGRDDYQARAMTVPKALRLGVARAADALLDMSLSVIGATVERCEAAAALAAFTDDALLALLDGPDRTVGAVMLSPDFAGALVQQQTLGRVMPASGTARAMTPTDAALCAPVLDAFLARAEAMLETDADRRILEGYRYGSRVENLRLLSLTLEAPEYHVIRLTLDVAGGVRQGQVMLCLPVRSATPAQQPDGTKDAAPGSDAPSLEKVVMSLPADLMVALCRIRLTVGELGKLAPGDVLQLPVGAFGAARVTTTTGRVLASGVLGQIDGQRALRLTAGAAGQDAPRRRADDRAALDLPEGAYFGEGAAGAAPAGQLPDLPDVSGLPDLADMPDFSDLPDLSDLPELSDLPDLPELGPLPQIKAG